MKPLSIRLQLSLMVSLLTLLIIVVLSVAAYIEFEESLLGNIDTTMQYMGEAILAELEEEGVSWENRETAFRAITGHGTVEYPSQCRIWMDGSTEDLFASGFPGMPVAPSVLRPPAEERPEAGNLSLFNLGIETGSYKKRGLRVMWMRHVLHEQSVNILVARSTHQVYHELEEFLRLLLLSGGSITLIALLLTPRIISWGLRPITDAGRRLEQITHRSLGQEGRITGNAPAELRPFKAALDGMLGRLNAAMKQQEQLTADVAHELRTPLAIMKSTLQMLRMQPRRAAEYEEGIDDALQDIERMERLVRQLLMLARLDAEDEIPDPEEVRLDVLLRSLVDTFDGQAGREGARVVCDCGEPLVIQGNETELRQLFTNLLDNALRHGPPKGLVRITLQDGPGPWATAYVHDEGGLIPEETLPRLFDRFYRVDGSRSQASGGAGLGLAIAHGIVLRHHGDIAITSNPQAGTLVTVRLPRK